MRRREEMAQVPSGTDGSLTMVTVQSWFDPKKEPVRSYRVTVETGDNLLGVSPAGEEVRGPMS
jgi:hypothetical protein